VVAAVRPFAVIDVPGVRTVPTSVPEVGVFGAVFPLARRTMTPAKAPEAGFTHVSATDEDVTWVTFSDRTGPGPAADALAGVDAPAAVGHQNAAATTTAIRHARTRTALSPLPHEIPPEGNLEEAMGVRKR
jgi:hypothetical protein